MRRLLLLSIALILSACTGYDDSEIWDKLRNHEERIEALETLCNRLNTNMESFQTLLSAVQNNDYVTNVVALMEGSNVIGYTISFAKSGPVTIYNGTDGQTPKVGIQKASDGQYYWTADGEWLTDEAGEKIPATVPDGEKYTTPQLRIADDNWYISYDNGNTWCLLGKVEEDEEKCKSLFQSIDTSNSDYVIFTLIDGTVFKVPTYKKATSYWYGKKIVCNGDSVPAGSVLSSVTQAFPYLVAEQLGMDLVNYAIGGTVVAKRSGDYDECYYDPARWEYDKTNGLLDKTKKYLVNTGNGSSRPYQIYKYNGTSWVGGGTSSDNAGRYTLSDRIGEMDDDADVIMVMAGSNDFYYNWNPFGNFEDGKYRNSGYVGSKDSAGQSVVIDESVNLLESEGVELIQKAAPTPESSEVDSYYSAYFTYKTVPVVGGRTLKVPYGRNAWWLDADMNDISLVNFTNGSKDFTHIAPPDAAYITVCFKYAEVQPEDCVIYMSKESVHDSYGKASLDPNETFCDGLHKLCRTLLEKYKNKDIIFLTPIKRLQETHWSCVYPEDKNSYGKMLEDYRNAIIECCEYYSIKYIDLYTLSGLNPHIDPSMFGDTDGKATHPTAEGHRQLASVIVAQMESMRAYTE